MATYRVLGGDRQEYGPATADEVRQWITEGRLNGESLVRPEGSAQWLPLATFPELAQALPPQSAPGAPPPLETSWSGPAVSPVADLHVGSCLVRSWDLLRAHFGLLFAATFLVWMLGMIMQFLPLVGFVYWLLQGVLYGGLYLVFLSCIRGRSTGVAEVFSGFGTGFAQLLLAGVMTSLLSGIGFLFCVLPWVYLTVAWLFAIPLVADRGMEFWSAMELSRKAVTRVWFKVFVLAVVAFLPVILMHGITELRVTGVLLDSMRDLTGSGAPDFARLMEKMPELMAEVARVSLPLVMLTKLVTLLNLPFALGALMFAYEDLFGSRPASGA